VPFVRPETVIGLPLSVTVMPPGFEVTVQLVIGIVSFAGNLKLTVAWPLPGVAVTPAGALGTVPGITSLEGPEAQDSAAIDITTMQIRTANDKKFAAFAFFLIVLRPKNL
jgi:hypothetical protein